MEGPATWQMSGKEAKFGEAIAKMREGGGGGNRETSKTKERGSRRERKATTLGNGTYGRNTWQMKITIYKGKNLKIEYSERQISTHTKNGSVPSAIEMLLKKWKTFLKFHRLEVKNLLSETLVLQPLFRVISSPVQEALLC